LFLFSTFDCFGSVGVVLVRRFFLLYEVYLHTNTIPILKGLPYEEKEAKA